VYYLELLNIGESSAAQIIIEATLYWGQRIQRLAAPAVICEYRWTMSVESLRVCGKKKGGKMMIVITL